MWSLYKQLERYSCCGDALERVVGLVEECTQESREDLETSQKILARNEVQGEAVEDGHSDEGLEKFLWMVSENLGHY